MQSILDIYVRLYKATGRYIEHSKMAFYSWQQKTRKGIKEIVDVKVELLINNQKIEQKSVNESTRSLRVYIIPSLNWKG